MKRPADGQLSRAEGEALWARLEAHPLTAEDRRVWGKVLSLYLWLLLARRAAKLSLKGVKGGVGGEKPQKPQPPASGGTSSGESAGGSDPASRASHGAATAAPASLPEKKPSPPGQGRQGAGV